MVVKFEVASFFTISDLFADFGGTMKTISLILSFTLFPIFAWLYRRDTIDQIVKDDPTCQDEDQAREQIETRLKPTNVFLKLGQVG